MTPKEQTRLQVLNSLLAEHMTLEQAAKLMGLSPRHTRRILADYRENGAASLAHGLRGRRPANAIPEATRSRAVYLASTIYEGANHTHLAELLSEREGIDMGRTTLRRILVSAGLSSPRRRRPPKHRVRRQRMPRAGMMIQLDGSHHRWLGEGGPQFALLFAVDDATGSVVNALFCEQEDSLSYFRLLEGLIQRRGVPLALYTGRHPVFKHRSEYQPSGTPTQFGRAMEELGVQLIFALSPQAKGRVERTAGTFQDRLATELRLAGAFTIKEAKAVLQQFLPRSNRRFQVPAQCPEPAFRPVGPEMNIRQILCFKHRRRVARDNTVKYHRHTLQLLPSQQRRSYAGAVVVVLEGLDGRLSLQHEGRIVASQVAPPSPGVLRNGNENSNKGFTLTRYSQPSVESKTTAPQALTTLPVDERFEGLGANNGDVDGLQVTASPGKPTFLQTARWKAVQQAKLEGMSIRRMARELGIHRDTVRRYIDADTPPTRRSPVKPTDPPSDTIISPASDISAEHLSGHLS